MWVKSSDLLKIMCPISQALIVTMGAAKMLNNTILVQINTVQKKQTTYPISKRIVNVRD